MYHRASTVILKMNLIDRFFLDLRTSPMAGHHMPTVVSGWSWAPFWFTYRFRMSFTNHPSCLLAKIRCFFFRLMSPLLNPMVRVYSVVFHSQHNTTGHVKRGYRIMAIHLSRFVRFFIPGCRKQQTVQLKYWSRILELYHNTYCTIHQSYGLQKLKIHLDDIHTNFHSM